MKRTEYDTMVEGPGKYEGENAYVPYFDGLDSCEDVYIGDDLVCSSYTVTSDDVAIFGDDLSGRTGLLSRSTKMILTQCRKMPMTSHPRRITSSRLLARVCRSGKSKGTISAHSQSTMMQSKPSKRICTRLVSSLTCLRSPIMATSN
mgnify:CR=1 FL=1